LKTSKKLAEGWGKPSNSRKWHYFGADGRSLCAKWAYFGEIEEGLDDSPDNCLSCRSAKHNRDVKGGDA
jgi:hypothetical protein